jgi:protein TonB
MPEYKGGTVELLRYFQKSYKLPSAPSDFTGSFHFEFVVEIDGAITVIKLRSKNIEDLTVAEKEALKVLEKMPNWIPGRCENNLVPVIIHLPIKI